MLMLTTVTRSMNGNISDEQAFETIKGGIDALPPGAKMMLNSGESGLISMGGSIDFHVSADFYGQGHSLGNLELLARFFEKYPGYAEKTFLSVKVCSTLLLVSYTYINPYGYRRVRHGDTRGSLCELNLCLRLLQ